LHGPAAPWIATVSTARRHLANYRAASAGKEQRKEGRQEVRGDEGESKEVTLATAFSEK